MPVLARILFVDDTPAEWQLAVASFGDKAVKEAVVVKDKDEALDFLYARGAFARRATGLPAVVVLGPSMRHAAALAMLNAIRSDVKLRRLPVVMIAASPDGQMIKRAYEQGVNSLVRRHDDDNVRAERYAALALFWGWANEPPPGSREQKATVQP